MSVRSLRKGPWADRALGLLYDLNERAIGAGGSRDGAAGVLEAFSSRLGTSRGAVAFAHRSGEVEVLSARGVTGEGFRRRCEKVGGAFSRLLSSGRGTVILLGSGAAVTADEHFGPLPLEAMQARGEVSFFCAPIPARGAHVPLVAVDRLFPDEIAPEEDAHLLQAAASLLSPLFTGASREGGVLSPRRGSAASLGKTLRRHIRAWIEPMQNTRRLRSDVYERLMGEVEKILITAALEKTDYVQTEAARFLGINRNTLARKIRQYGLGKK